LAVVLAVVPRPVSKDGEDGKMLEYMKTQEIAEPIDAVDALNDLQCDLHGLAALLLAVANDPSYDLRALNTLHTFAQGMADGADAVFPLAVAALEEMAENGRR